MFNFRCILGLFFSLFLLYLQGCDDLAENEYEPDFSPESGVDSQALIFGVHPLHNPQRLFSVYQPLIDYLNRKHKQPVIRLEASRNYAAFNARLFRGYYHFALPNPYQTIVAADSGYTIFAKMGDDHNFHGIILVRKDSSIRKVSDLAGKSISYPAPTALAATMLPQWFFYSHGLDLMHDTRRLYVGSQESSIMNVYLGQVAAAATWPPPWQAFSRENPAIAREVKIMWQTRSLPNNGLVYRSDLAKDIVANVTHDLLQLHTHVAGREILRRMELSRFEWANYQTYDPVRQFIAQFERHLRPVRSAE
ncbi:MAG: phosphate/phosphite/phosphonate ABC transporter substrate-binding protein [Leptospiraceae bacterium]|nr:phosphate/phosphite/phosphonate ABC transporter substrate-binding protein [Leptospiraceae bacterium]